MSKCFKASVSIGTGFVENWVLNSIEIENNGVVYEPQSGLIAHASLGPDSLKEAFIEECALIRSDMLESDLTVEGEFLSEKAMREDNGFSEPLSSHKNQQYLLFVAP